MSGPSAIPFKPVVVKEMIAGLPPETANAVLFVALKDGYDDLIDSPRERNEALAFIRSVNPKLAQERAKLFGPEKIKTKKVSSKEEKARIVSKYGIQYMFQAHQYVSQMGVTKCKVNGDCENQHWLGVLRSQWQSLCPVGACINTYSYDVISRVLFEGGEQCLRHPRNNDSCCVIGIRRLSFDDPKAKKDAGRIVGSELMNNDACTQSQSQRSKESAPINWGSSSGYYLDGHYIDSSSSYHLE